ncbi:MAG: CARDB domain-containing protein [Dehalococcoidales bacterium]|nr:CARDB domain-containing protein [Dehalococcoidales bacterium]
MKIVFRTLVIAIALCLLLIPTAAMAQSQPPTVPLLYHGNVTIAGEDAPIGTVITAEIGGQEVATNSPGGTTDTGIYELPVAANQGDLVVLKVNGVFGGQTTHPSSSTWDVPLNLAAENGPTPPPALTVTTLAASSVSRTTATLNGMLNNPGGNTSVEVSFEWGISDEYGNETPPQVMTDPGSFSASLNGLSSGRAYHFRAKAVGTTTVRGSDRIFTTSTSSGGSGGSGGMSGGETPTLSANLFGTIRSFNINSNGIVQGDIKGTSADGKLTITIPSGTKALDRNGGPLTSLTARSQDNPPPPPESANIIGLAYDFSPAGATFNPPFTLTWQYDPAAIPEGVAAEDLVIAYYDEESSKWVELQCMVNAETDTITASVEHFSTFALIGAIQPAHWALSLLEISPPTVSSGERVTITVSVANDGGMEGNCTVALSINGVKEEINIVTVGPGKSQTVSFSVLKNEPGSYSVNIGELSGNFTIEKSPSEPAAFAVSDLTVNPAEIQPDGMVTVTAIILNTGGSDGSYKAMLMVNNAREAERSVVVAAGSQETISFTLSKKEAGSYTVDVGGVTRNFTVINSSGPTPDNPFNWPLVGGIIAAVVVLALLVTWLLRRSK